MNGEWILVAEKILQSSDLNTNQNRLLLRRSDAHQRLLPLLQQSDLEAVMNSNGGLKIEISTDDSEKSFEVQFKHWGSSNGFIFNGRGWRNLRSHFEGGLAAGNILRFYAFLGDGEEEEEEAGEIMRAADILVSFRGKLIRAVSGD